MPALKEEIRNAALQLGFSHAGFARAEALPDAPLMAWLARGRHGAMAYMARSPQARLDPREIFPGCETVISLSLNYYTPYPVKARREHGKISRYAWGRDYHKVMRAKLKALGRKITEMAPEARMKMCVDTSPVLEKAWAARAGIGWQGKHSNLITRDFGSWVFLGEILTTLELEPDAPHADFCGTCTRCMDACPTQAIVEPYVVDGSRCISHLTIEAKETGSAELQEKTGEWIFGCDVCQDVCPWNKFSQTTREEDFFPRLDNQISLQAWMEMDAGSFSGKFSGTPFMRPKQKRMAENAKIALRNRENGRAASGYAGMIGDEGNSCRIK